MPKASEEQTDVDGWAQLLDARLSTRDQLPAVVSVPLTSRSKYSSCRSAVPGTATSMAMTGSLGSLGNSTPNGNAATHETAAQEFREPCERSDNR